MNVTGTLLANYGVHCYTGDPLWTGDGSSSVVTVHPVTQGVGLTGGHGNCSGSHSWSFPAGGTTPDGHFSFTLGGGGVSWLGGSGLTNLASWVELEFRDCNGGSLARVSCGNSATYSVLPGCANSPEIYGEVASPDLNGTGGVDGSDLIVWNMFGGHPVTAESGWQADFNHVNPNVDASDLAYLAGRMGKFCVEGQQKTGEPSYQMDVSNLERDDVRAVMANHGITIAHILAAWDAMGLSYDKETAASILASDETGEQSSSWSRVKTLYR